MAQRLDPLSPFDGRGEGPGVAPDSMGGQPHGLATPSEHDLITELGT